MKMLDLRYYCGNHQIQNTVLLYLVVLDTFRVGKRVGMDVNS